MKENEQKTLLRSSDDLIAAVEQYGFLPFFRNEIHGFSIEIGRASCRERV